MIPLIIGIAPVLIFLTALVLLDSYKLVRLHSVLAALAAGAVAAGAAWWINRWMLNQFPVGSLAVPRYIAPAVEETLKALYILHCIRTHRVGFMVDGAILGFAAGSGFACVENAAVLQSHFSSHILLWMIRGLGTAVMHGGTTASVAIVCKTLFDRKNRFGFIVIAPALLTGIAMHSFFNHFFLHPLLMTILQLILLPLMISLVFKQSEKLTKLWLEVGMDTDVWLLESIHSGGISNTRIGKYIWSLSARFSPLALADMLCYLRVHLELSIQAKGILLMREAGFDIPACGETREKLKELKYLEKSIGKTGLLALAPVFHTSHHDLWQIYMVSKR